MNEMGEIHLLLPFLADQGLYASLPSPSRCMLTWDAGVCACESVCVRTRETGWVGLRGMGWKWGGWTFHSDKCFFIVDHVMAQRRLRRKEFFSISFVSSCTY